MGFHEYLDKQAARFAFTQHRLSFRMDHSDLGSYATQVEILFHRRDSGEPAARMVPRRTLIPSLDRHLQFRGLQPRWELDDLAVFEYHWLTNVGDQGIQGVLRDHLAHLEESVAQQLQNRLYILVFMNDELVLPEPMRGAQKRRVLEELRSPPKIDLVYAVDKPKITAPSSQ